MVKTAPTRRIGSHVMGQIDLFGGETSPWISEAGVFCAAGEHEKELFRRLIWDYYGQHRRDMPWREDTSPYSIFISEVMLQQTQVSRVRDKYVAFREAFPSFETLAEAPFAAVLSLWQGLGYNRRARYLHEAAKIVVDRHAGALPREIEKLVELPGIGPNTAGSIATFAYQVAVPFIETNVRRVYIHHFFPAGAQVHDREVIALVARTLDKENPREWFWALMDFGTMLKAAVANPNRRSRHYTRQSRFEGSDRQIRGQVLRLLAARGPLPIEQFPRRDEPLITEGLHVAEGEKGEVITASVERLERIVAQLRKERFLTRDEGGVYRIVE